MKSMKLTGVVLLSFLTITKVIYPRMNMFRTVMHSFCWIATVFIKLLQEHNGTCTRKTKQNSSVPGKNGELSRLGLLGTETKSFLKPDAK